MAEPGASPATGGRRGSFAGQPGPHRPSVAIHDLIPHAPTGSATASPAFGAGVSPNMLVSNPMNSVTGGIRGSMLPMPSPTGGWAPAAGAPGVELAPLTTATPSAGAASPSTPAGVTTAVPAASPARPNGLASARNALKDTNQVSLRSKSAWVGLQRSGSNSRIISSRMSVADEAALFEHRIVATSFSSSSVIRREFGRGVYGYYIFLEYLIVINALLGITSSVVFALSYFKQTDAAKKTLSAAFVGLYPTEYRNPWFISTVIILGLPFLASFFYPLIHNWRMRAGEDAREQATAGDTRDDLATRLVTRSEKRWRRTLSGLAFVLLIGIQGGITYGLYMLLDSLSGNSTVSMVIALANNILNFINKNLNKQLTHFERHRKITRHRESDTIKLFVLKFANVIALYAIKAYLVRSEGVQAFNPEAVAASCPLMVNGTAVASGSAAAAGATVSTSCNCPLLSMATTFLWLLIFDVAFSVVIEPGAGLINSWYRRSIATSSGLSDVDTKLEFDIAEEFVSVLYRQFIILLGAPVFPTITAMGFVAYVIEYYMDRMKLVNLCRKNIIREEPLDMRVLVICSVLVSVAAAFVYPQGMLFIMLGYGNNVKECAFFI